MRLSKTFCNAMKMFYQWDKMSVKNGSIQMHNNFPRWSILQCVIFSKPMAKFTNLHLPVKYFLHPERVLVKEKQQSFWKKAHWSNSCLRPICPMDAKKIQNIVIYYIWNVEVWPSSSFPYKFQHSTLQGAMNITDPISLSLPTFCTFYHHAKMCIKVIQ